MADTTDILKVFMLLRRFIVSALVADAETREEIEAIRARIEGSPNEDIIALAESISAQTDQKIEALLAKTEPTQ